MYKIDYAFAKGTLHYDEGTDDFVGIEDYVVLYNGTIEVDSLISTEVDDFVVRFAEEFGLVSSIEDWTYNPGTERFRHCLSLDNGNRVEAHYVYIEYHKSDFSRRTLGHTEAGYDFDE